MVGNNDKVERMVVQGGEKIGENQRKIGDAGCNPDKLGEIVSAERYMMGWFIRLLLRMGSLQYCHTQ